MKSTTILLSFLLLFFVSCEKKSTATKEASAPKQPSSVASKSAAPLSSVIVGDRDFEQFVTSSITNIGSTLSESSLERLKYSRYLIGEFLNQNANLINPKNIKKELVGLDRNIIFRTEVAKCLAQKGKDLKASSILDDSTHPLRAKFSGTTLFEESEYPYIKSVTDITHASWAKENATYAKEKGVACNDPQIKIFLDLKFKSKHHFDINKAYEMSEESYWQCDIDKNAKGKEIIISNLCNKLTNYIVMDDFQWSKSDKETFEKRTNHLVDTFNLVKFLNQRQGEKVTKEIYRSVIKDLIEVNKTFDIKELGKLTRSIYDKIEPTLRDQKDDLTLLREIIRNFTNSQSGVPSMFQTYIITLDDHFSSQDKVTIGNVLSLLRDHQKKCVFNILKDSKTPKATWSDFKNSTVCDNLSDDSQDDVELNNNINN